MPVNKYLSLLVFAAVVAITGCESSGSHADSKDSAPASEVTNAPDPGASDLKRVCEELRSAIVSGDTKTAANITRSLLPDDARLRTALSPDVDETFVTTVLQMHAEFSKSEEQLAQLLATKAERSVIAVHAATTEEILAYAPGSTAYREFTGGAKTLAEKKILREQMTFYEVEFLEPGHDKGMKYHLFFWDGHAWTMLGPVWRIL